MFAYNPTVNDNSGQILAGYKTNSAEIKAAGNEALASGIMDGVTNAFSGIAGAYTQSKMQQAGGKAFKDFMSVAGPSMGITDEQLKLFKTMPDQDAYQMSSMMMPVAPSMVSATGLGNHYNSMARMQTNAANQAALRQPPANQVPTPASTPQSPNWMGLVPNRP
jgi:hypothetical protein